ncbi:hypothetical protein SeMB42_g00491 [Synchytrium endobioticum]|uniref:Uncharacterized protein n=1 Tax=Synchytrium endobioticum TaxID=286115 RepID=A0A507DIW2_9FUNG|nr:hypothetical protein SeLEV6574_g00350 [Synchytrium endobioticum]TPX54068.1 hypothetical protein SeMB42_g00491 [Synchytrium endobioticum]
MLRWNSSGDVPPSLTDLAHVQKLDGLVQQSLQFSTEVREFVREQADLDKEYSKKIESLCRKYSSKREKDVKKAVNGSSEGLQVDDIPARRAWTEILRKMEDIAKRRSVLADSLLEGVADELKSHYNVFEESKRKQLSFAQRLMAERDRIAAEIDKVKDKYNSRCDAVEVARVKSDSGTTTNVQEKMRKQWHAEILEMNSAKNSYLLSIKSANSLCARLSENGFPLVIEGLESLNEAVVGKVAAAVQRQVTLLKDHDTDILVILNDIDDIAKMSIRAAEVPSRPTKPTDEPEPEFYFEPSGLWKETGMMATDEHSKIWLRNKLRKLRLRQSTLEAEVSRREKEVEGLENLHVAYTENPLLGDAYQVHENMLDATREQRVVELEIATVGSQISTILDSIGEDPSNTSWHDWKASSYSIPTQCDICLTNIWGVGSGLCCQSCSSNVHSRCEFRVPPTCKKSTPVRQHRSISLTSKTALATLRLSSPSSGPKDETGGENGGVGILSRRVSKSGVLSRAPGHNVEKTTMLVAPSAEADHIHQVERKATVLYDFTKASDDELDVRRSEVVVIVEDDQAGWTRVANSLGESGLIPTLWLSPHDSSLSAATIPTIKGSVSKQQAASNSAGSQSSRARVLYDYSKASEDELDVCRRDLVTIVEPDMAGWTRVSNSEGEVGLVPTAWLEVI